MLVNEAEPLVWSLILCSGSGMRATGETFACSWEGGSKGESNRGEIQR